MATFITLKIMTNERESAQSQMRGRAATFLEDNPCRETILNHVKNTRVARGVEALQLYWAVVGNCLQCDFCFRYFASRSLLLRHLRATPSCRDPGYKYKYKFATTEDNRFFCYYGCGVHEKRLSLEDHLLTEHRDGLHIWGISPQLLLDHRVLNPPEKTESRLSIMTEQSIDPQLKDPALAVSSSPNCRS
jgi:hypothetical protein